MCKGAVDGVGSGHSSLDGLILLEPDFIKIEARFVAEALHDPDHRSWLVRLLTVAKELGAEAIAEGVEERADAIALRKIGVRLAQGCLWADLA